MHGLSLRLSGLRALVQSAPGATATPPPDPVPHRADEAKALDAAAAGHHAHRIEDALGGSAWVSYL